MSLPPLPPQPQGVAWPTVSWPTGELPTAIDRARFDKLMAQAFAAPVTEALGETQALVVVQGGRLIFERYNEGYGPDDTYASWSMAKSITQALVGIAKGDGRIDPAGPADIPQWKGADDPRRAITLDVLLRMSSGLQWIEEYSPGYPSDVRAMLFAEGQDDVAAYAAAVPLAHEPGTFFQYSSGTTNLVVLALSRALGLKGAAFEGFMRERLFDPLGMTSPIPKFDKAGTFIGSSYCFCSARDFARFGLLYLRDGLWDGRRILPEGWVDYARTPTFQQPGAAEMRYGAHWWLDIGGPGSFSANGYDGQFIVCVPDLDLVVVRHGRSEAQKEAVKAWIGKAVDCFRP